MPWKECHVMEAAQDSPSYCISLNTTSLRRSPHVTNIWRTLGASTACSTSDRGLRDRDGQFGYHRHSHP